MSELPEERREREEHSTLEDITGIARVAATAWWRSAQWAAETSVRTAGQVLGIAAPEAADRISQVSEVAREAAHELGSSELGERVRDAVPEGGVAGKVMAVAADVTRPRGRGDGAPLSEQGEELLRRSRDVHYEVDAHPAYERMLADLAPDEARILRLLMIRGPQPSVDVRTGGPIGLLSSRLILQGVTMIGAHAGCRYVDRVPSYLNNLNRLGMVWFSRETLHDPLPYQVLEAQPELLEAMHAVRFPRVVRRSIHLTPFGADFCRQALALETVDPASLPEHGSPDEDDSSRLAKVLAAQADAEQD